MEWLTIQTFNRTFQTKIDETRLALRTAVKLFFAGVMILTHQCGTTSLTEAQVACKSPHNFPFLRVWRVLLLDTYLRVLLCINQWWLLGAVAKPMKMATDVASGFLVPINQKPVVSGRNAASPRFWRRLAVRKKREEFVRRWLLPRIDNHDWTYSFQPSQTFY